MYSFFPQAPNSFSQYKSARSQVRSCDFSLSPLEFSWLLAKSEITDCLAPCFLGTEHHQQS